VKVFEEAEQMHVPTPGEAVDLAVIGVDDVGKM
jgi:hypothetical protein